MAVAPPPVCISARSSCTALQARGLLFINASNPGFGVPVRMYGPRPIARKNPPVMLHRNDNIAVSQGDSKSSKPASSTIPWRFRITSVGVCWRAMPKKVLSVKLSGASMMIL